MDPRAPAGPAPAPGAPASPWLPPPPAPRRGNGFAAALPLIAAVLTVPWFLTVVFEMITQGARTTKGADPRAVAIVTMIPALCGLLAGAIAAARGRARSRGQRIVLGLGLAACALIVLGAGRSLP